jgi:hypothetical protein
MTSVSLISITIQRVHSVHTVSSSSSANSSPFDPVVVEPSWHVERIFSHTSSSFYDVCRNLSLSRIFRGSMQDTIICFDGRLVAYRARFDCGCFHLPLVHYRCRMRPVCLSGYLWRYSSHNFHRSVHTPAPYNTIHYNNFQYFF